MSYLEDAFITILNMSITASYVAIAVIAARLLLRKAPKVFSYALWSIVLFRLVCPFSFSSGLSLLGLINSSQTSGFSALKSTCPLALREMSVNIYCVMRRYILKDVTI